MGLRGWRGIGLVHPLDDIDYKIIARTGLCEGERVDVLYFDDCGIIRETRTKLLGAAVKCNSDKENHDSKEIYVIFSSTKCSWRLSLLEA